MNAPSLSRLLPSKLSALVVLATASTLAAQTPAKAAAPAGQSGHERTLAMLKEIKDRTDQENVFLGDKAVREKKAALDALPPGDSAARCQALAEFGDATVYYGNEREGLAFLQQAYDMIPKVKDKLPAGAVEEFKLKFATCWLRLAETENCCANHNDESCILPLAGAATHTKKEGGERAIALLTEVLDATPANAKVHLDAEWYLNMINMALGEYPDGVPEKYRIPPAWFQGDEKFPKFKNIAGEVGVDFTNLAGSIIADDFDNDDDIDLMMTGYGSDGQLEYYRNNGDGTFTRRTHESGIDGLFGGLNLIQCDYDGDGWLDAFVMRGAWLGKVGCHPRSLLHNNHDGTFTDRAFEAGLNAAMYPSMNSVWTDYDNDGDLDVYIGNESSKEINAPNQLFQNKGDGTFVDVAKAAGVTNDRFAKGVIAGDYDGDRDADFYVSNLYGDNRLYKNKGDGTFEDVAPALGLTGPNISLPCWFWDYNNDGALDILVLAFQAMPHDITAAALGMPFEANLPALYKGDGKGGFTEVGKASNLVKPFSVMGANFGDFDNDGWLDFYAGTGRPQAREIVPNMAYHNKGGKSFADVTLSSGLGHVQKGHGRVFADFDNDGDLDIVAQMGGAFRADLFHNAFYENPGFGNHWLAVKLEGKQTNRCAMGARIRADFTDEGGVKRSEWRWVDSGGSFGANPLRQHLGFGKATKVDQLEIFWPTTGKTQTFKDLPVDRFVKIVEGSEPVIKELKPVKLGRAN